LPCLFFSFFFFQAEDGIRVATVTGVQTCALPISHARRLHPDADRRGAGRAPRRDRAGASPHRRRAPIHDRRARIVHQCERRAVLDRKSTRLNSSHGSISYAVFCLKKKKQKTCTSQTRTTNK